MDSPIIRFAARNAGMLRAASAWTAVAIVVGLAIAGPVQWWLTWIGMRDARALAEAERLMRIEKCREERGETARALVDQETGALICFSRDMTAKKRNKYDVY